MRHNGLDLSRRRLMQGVAAFGVATLMPYRTWAQQSSAASGSALPLRSEFLVRGATVLTMDPKLPDLAVGDVHVRDGTIVAVAPEIEAAGAQIIDGAGMICMPGFVDTHFHLWNSLFRLFARSDEPKLGYFPVTTRLGAHTTADDHYRGARFGISEALTAGITTLLNFAHNIRSPEYAHAELTGMKEMGIRGRFAYGTPIALPDDVPMDFAGLESVMKDWGPKGDGLLTFGISSRNVGLSTSGGTPFGNLSADQARRDWDGARALGVPISLHTSGVSPISVLEDAGLLGPDVQLVHPMRTTAEERAILKARGVSYSMSPSGESRRPSEQGVIQLGELLQAGVKVSLATDTNLAMSCDPFGAMRMLYALHSHRIGRKSPLTMKRLVQLGTIDGAVDLGIADLTGSLTPGKRADIILVRTTDPNMAPVGNAYEALVSRAQPSNVDTVVVDGRVLRRGNQFTVFDQGKIASEAYDAAIGVKERAKWPI